MRHLNRFLLSVLGLFCWVGVHAEWITAQGTWTGTIRCIHPWDKRIVVGADSGIFQSLDSGKTWSKTDSGLPKGYTVWSLARKDSLYFAATEANGIFVSKDWGLSWKRTDTASRPYGGTALAECKGALFLGNDRGAYRSLDDGVSWKSLLDGGPVVFKHFYRLAVRDSQIFAGTYGGGVYRSSDQGDTWEQMKTFGYPFDALSLEVFGGEIYVGGKGGAVYRSADGGESWESIPLPQSQAKIFSLAADSKTLFAGTDGEGIYRFDKEQSSWVSVDTTMGSKHIVSLAIMGNRLFAGSYLKQMLMLPLSEPPTSISGSIHGTIPLRRISVRQGGREIAPNRIFHPVPRGKASGFNLLGARQVGW